MNVKPLILYPLLGSLLLAIGTTGCSEQGSGPHTVRPIELKAMLRIVAKEDFSGLVVAMASWCPSCRKELPLLAELYRRHQEEGVEIVAVSVEADGPKAVQSLVNTLEIPFPVYWVGPAAAEHYRLIGIPTLIIYDHGRLREKIPGSQPLEALEAKIKTLLPGAGPSGGRSMDQP